MATDRHSLREWSTGPRARGHPGKPWVSGDDPGLNLKESNVNVTIEAETSYLNTVKTCDSTGKKLSDVDIEAQKASRFMGRVQISIHAGHLAITRFNVGLIRGKQEIFVSQEKGFNGKDAFTLGDELIPLVNEAAREAIKIGHGVVTRTVEL